MNNIRKPARRADEILFWMERDREPKSASDLAELCETTSPNLHAAIQEVVRKGYVLKEKNELSGLFMYFLTKDGIAAATAPGFGMTEQERLVELHKHAVKELAADTGPVIDVPVTRRTIPLGTLKSAHALAAGGGLSMEGKPLEAETTFPVPPELKTCVECQKPLPPDAFTDEGLGVWNAKQCILCIVKLRAEQGEVVLPSPSKPATRPRNALTSLPKVLPPVAAEPTGPRFGIFSDGSMQCEVSSGAMAMKPSEVAALVAFVNQIPPTMIKEITHAVQKNDRDQEGSESVASAVTSIDGGSGSRNQP